ncbi:MAG: guanylate kinase [Planctomycetota bacterium]|nr:guanylate kinase [Planctomycetota bacterium]
MTEGRNSNPGLLAVISGPSGVGKTTIVRAVKERLDAVFSVSATTRTRTHQETDGVDYYFMTTVEFDAMRKKGDFLEHATVFGRNSYGTPRKPVEAALTNGRLVILEIDVQGGIQIRQSAPQALLIFITPPSEDVLLKRLQARGRDDEDAIQHRYAQARNEIEKANSSGVYDEFVVNDDLESAIVQTCSIIAERLGRESVQQS